MYSIKFDDGKVYKHTKGIVTIAEKKAKRIVKSVIEKDIRHEMYRNILHTGGKQRSEMTVIRSVKHQLYTTVISKVSLSAYDDKRWIKKDGISSYAYGHYKTLPK